MSAPPPKSGHKRLWRGMSAFDPKQTLAQFGDHTGFTSHSAGGGGAFCSVVSED